MRIENLDRARDSGAAHTQLADLASIGIDWDGEPVWQTDRTEAYAQVLERLTAQGLTYECYCTRQDILNAPTAPHQPPGHYPGNCANLSSAERAAAKARIAPRRPAIRVRLAEHTPEVTFTDLVCGETTGLVDDLVVMRGDGTYAYNLVSVVDDSWQGVNQVVRGDDLISSTPRQLALQLLLGLGTPEYAHVPLVLNSTRQRLAKRDGAVTLAELIEAGQTPASVRALLAHSLGLAHKGETVSMQQLSNRFDLQLLPREPWVWRQAGHRR